ncbi:MAG: NarK/NasA family nitrate transporter [Rhodospirillales bacterium]|nr:NarK/NasA family nitrate transporter [Rhodospirillales bacterium]
MVSREYKGWSVVVASTTAFTVCFAVWMMFAVIGIPIKTTLGLSETQFGLLVAMPVLTGSLIRVPLGMLTDYYGGRVVFFVLMFSLAIPVWLVSHASAYWHYLALSLFVGAVGGSFAVGIAYCAHWFERRRQGLAMGIFGVGNVGAAVTKFVAPSLVVAFGWQMVPQVYAAALLVMAALFWMTTYTDPSHSAGETRKVTLRAQLAVLKEPNIWKYCQFYSIVFGGYVALSLWMTKHYISEYGFDIRVAALLAAAFSLPGGVLRALGGWISDQYGAHPVTWWVMLFSWVCLAVLSLPQIELTIKTSRGDLSFGIGLNVWLLTALMFAMGVAWAIGKASIFKYISDEYTGPRLGTVAGMVGMFGGLGGFLLPIQFGLLVDLTGINSTVFMLMWGVTTVSLIWMYWTEIVSIRRANSGGRVVRSAAGPTEATFTIGRSRDG